MSFPRKELVDYFLQRADETLADAQILAGAGSWHSCINRTYYACFYAVQALLNQKLELETKTHSGIKALFNQHFVKEGLISIDLSRFYTTLMQRRGTNDYSAFDEAMAADAVPLLTKAEAFIATIKNIVIANS